VLVRQVGREAGRTSLEHPHGSVGKAAVHGLKKLVGGELLLLLLLLLELLLALENLLGLLLPCVDVVCLGTVVLHKRTESGGLEQ